MQLVIGLGEVGQAVQKVLECPGIDKGDEVPQAKVIHVCIPYLENFVEVVREYQRKTGAYLTVIHSTVAVGTSDKLGAVHSPIRGVHPHLEEGVRTFVKFFGGGQALEASRLFAEKGVKVKIVKDARTSEALKLWDTEQYRRAILLNKEIYKWCEDNDIDFNDVYTEANKTYNSGYAELGRTEVMKPVLKYVEGPIGGHCLEPNHKILFAEESPNMV